MKILDLLDTVVGWAGGAALLVVLGMIFYGLARGLHRPVGRQEGRAPGLLHSIAFYILASLIYFGICYLLWKPLPVPLSVGWRITALILGALLFFLGLGLTLWGRLSLGKMYFVSTTLGAQLYADHRLVDQGPYAWVRHPMYLGILLTGLGGILLYRTWTFVFVALHFVGLVFRARREEKALAAEFGEGWQEYCQRTPRFFPRLRLSALHPGLATLLEVGVMFLPAIPAYLWVWSNVEGGSLQVMNIISYVYVLAGTLWIGLRRYKLHQLGVNKNGLVISLAMGLLIILGRSLVILAVDWQLSPPQFDLLRLLGETLFYFGLVGVTEELLFRGLIYRALEDWRGANGTRWAIWGSSFGFMLWHIFGQGPLVGAAMLFYGLIFALMRWRAGGIVGLVIVHGLIDLLAAQMLPDIDVVSLGRPEVPHTGWLLLGLAMLVFVPLYLWKLHPLVEKIFRDGKETRP